jgi:hypothetical protein
MENGGVTPLVAPSPKKYNKIQKYKKSTKIQNTKKKYRGRGIKNRRDTTFTIMISNLRGLKSKKKIPDKNFGYSSAKYAPDVRNPNGRTNENSTGWLYYLD